MFKIIKNFNWIIISSFTCIFLGIITFLTFINEGFVPLNEKNLFILLFVDIILLLIFFYLIFKNFIRFYTAGQKNKSGSQTNFKYVSAYINCFICMIDIKIIQNNSVDFFKLQYFL